MISPAPVFHEDWYDAALLERLAALAYGCRGLSGAFVEVGCWEGRSTIAIAQAIAPARLYAVDTWAGSPGHESAQTVTVRDVYAQFLDNVAGLSNVEPHRQDWREFLAEFNGPLAFCHIDGDHRHSAVYDNILAVLPRLVPGGIVCGHDYWHWFPGVMAAVDTLLPLAEKQGPLWWWQK